jgi:glutamate dehydrogenase
VHIAALPRGDRWQTEARAALRDEFHDSHEELIAAVLTGTRDAPAETRVDAWLDANREVVERFRHVRADIESTGVFDLATLAVARRALRELATTCTR